MIDKTIVKTGDELRSHLQSRLISFMSKPQTNISNYNHFISGKICLEFYDCKVAYIEEKSLVFIFDKSTHLSLLMLLRSISDSLNGELSKIHTRLISKECFPLYYETEEKDAFTVKCYLPKRNGIYQINCGGQQFRMPRKGGCYKSVIVHLKNIWEQKDKTGFNLELLSIVYD